MSYERRSAARFAALLAIPLLFAGNARAAGFEQTSPGARSNGRGGADFAGGDSPMGMFYNPANLVRGGDARLRLEVGLHLHLAERCMERVEVIEADPTDPESDRQAGTTYPSVCGESGVGTIPELAGSFRLSDRLALGFGVSVPPAATRTIAFGDDETGRFDPDGDGPEPEQLTPTRFALLKSELLQLHLNVGFAYATGERFRVGASFGWGITTAEYATSAYSRTPVTVLGLPLVYAESDIRMGLSLTDAFVPRVHLGAWARPIRAVPIEVAAAFQYTQNVRAGGSTVHIRGIETRLPQFVEALGLGDGISIDQTVEGLRVEAPQNAWLAFSIRYAHALPAPVDDVGDRMSTERFDFEVALATYFHRRAKAFLVTVPEDAAIVVPSPLPGIVDDIRNELPDQLELEKNWRTQVSVRAGGDFNVVPGVLALRAGFSYESDGVEDGYEQLDFQPWEIFGVHAGATLRLFHKVDVSLAYSHVFQPDVIVGVDDARLRRTAAGEPEPGDDELINAGRFTGSSNIFIAQVGASF